MTAIQVPAYTSRYFGYDGPWQAVSVEVGGFNNGSTPSSQWKTVQVMPGSDYSSFFIPSSYCQNSTLIGECGTGGTWDPGPLQTQSGKKVDFQPWVDVEHGINAFGSVRIEDLSIVNPPGQPSNTNSITAPNVSLVTIESGNMTYANGVVTNIELGVLSLGGNSSHQIFTKSNTNASVLPITSWLLPSYLYNVSITPSYSFSLHVGSSRFDYPISLWFGGYDKSRAIGPYTTWEVTSPQLLMDVTIGIEVGKSPFNSTTPSSFLSEQIHVTPNALAPGINLPDQTCRNLVENLPVTFNQSMGYYIWDTTSPSYDQIVNSPAYLGFVFPPATGSTDKVTIKVPFSLLHLRLDPIISGMDEPVQYFPCMHAPSSYYTLGRAFLQAAFWAGNYNTQVQWLAQAPGPGPTKDGLGSQQPINIENEDTTIELYEEESLFRRSWSMYWTPLADDASTSNSSSNGTTQDHGLSTAASVGIGVGVGVGVLLLLIVAFVVFWRRRKRQRQQSKDRTKNVHHASEEDSRTSDYSFNQASERRGAELSELSSSAELDGQGVLPELGVQKDRAELGNEEDRAELDDQNVIAELGGEKASAQLD